MQFSVDCTQSAFETGGNFDGTKLKSCPLIDSDLILEKGENILQGTRIEKIAGCLRLINIKNKNLDFLNLKANVLDKCKDGRKSIVSSNMTISYKQYYNLSTTNLEDVIFQLGGFF